MKKLAAPGKAGGVPNKSLEMQAQSGLARHEKGF